MTTGLLRQPFFNIIPGTRQFSKSTVACAEKRARQIDQQMMKIRGVGD